MKSALLSRFGSREFRLGVLAVLLAIANVCLAFVIGPFGAGGVLLWGAWFGTVLFVALAGAERCFYTALFTGLQYAIVLGLVVYRTATEQYEYFDREFAFIFSLALLTMTVLPILFAWFATWVHSRVL